MSTLAPTAAEYEKALEVWRAAASAFSEVQRRYHSLEIGDAEFLAGKKAFASAQAILDGVEKAFVARAALKEEWNRFCGGVADPELGGRCNADMFRADHSGYWARGVEVDEALGWLVWDTEAREGHEDEEGDDERSAIAAWRAGSELPDGYYRLDRAAAERAWEYGCRKWGEDWYADGDASTYDQALQHGLLGEVRYG